MTSFNDVRKFLIDLEKKHSSCPQLCVYHIQKTRKAIDAIELIDSFVDKLDKNPRLISILRETVILSEKLQLLALLSRLSILINFILKPLVKYI